MASVWSPPTPYCGICLGDIEKGEPGYTCAAFAVAQDGWTHSDNLPHDHLVAPRNTSYKELP